MVIKHSIIVYAFVFDLYPTFCGTKVPQRTDPERIKGKNKNKHQPSQKSNLSELPNAFQN